MAVYDRFLFLIRFIVGYGCLWQWMVAGCLDYGLCVFLFDLGFMKACGGAWL